MPYKTDPALLGAALTYAQREWYVVACHHITTGGVCSCGGKDKQTGKPCKPAKHPRWHKQLLPHGLKSATIDPGIINQWWSESNWPRANVAINCELSGLVVVDVDPKHGGNETWAALVKKHGAQLEATYTVITQSGGKHFYFSADEARPISSREGVLGPGVDVKAMGGYVVAPPSRGQDGTYRCDDPEVAIAPLPPELRELLSLKLAAEEFAPKRSGSKLAQLIREAAKDDPIGVYSTALELNPKAFRKRGAEYYFICPLHNDSKPSCRISTEKGLWTCDVCEPYAGKSKRGGDVIDLYASRVKCTPMDAVKPLAALLGIEDEDKPGRKSVPQQLYEMVVAEGAESCRDFDDVTYLTVPLNEVWYTYPIDSRKCADYLRKLYFTTTGKVTSPEAVTIVIGQLRANASFGAARAVDYRYASDPATGDILIDRGDAAHSIVRISAEGVYLESYSPECPVRFYRNGTMGVLPEPDLRVDPKKVKKHLFKNFFNVEEADEPLMLGWTLSSMQQAEQYGILEMACGSDDGKSTKAKMLARIIDPGKTKLSRQPKDIRTYTSKLRNTHLVAFDNLSYIDDLLSDAMCASSTGAGVTEAELYVNFGEVGFYAARPQLYTTIKGAIARREDLLRRLFRVRLRTIVEHQPGKYEEGFVRKRDEDTLWREFDAYLPKLLGALYLALSAGLARIKNVQVGDDVKMPNVARMACAALPTLGILEKTFLERYTANQAEGKEQALDNWLPYTYIMQLLDKEADENGEWRKSPEVLLKKLHDLATGDHGDNFDVVNLRDWPKSPNKLSAEIMDFKKALQLNASILFSRGKSNGARWIHFKRITPQQHLNGNGVHAYSDYAGAGLEELGKEEEF